MKKSIKTQHSIQAPANAVWDLIKTGANWEDWLPILSGSKVEGNIRTCDLTTPDGGIDVLEESFLAFETDMLFMYQINKQQSFPATDIVAYMKVNDNDGKTLLNWNVEMNVDSEETFDMIKTQITQIYSASASRLEELATVAV